MYKLLIVDDELANIRLLERLFRDYYYCLTASSGEEAVTILDQHEVAVIITDQRMPKMTGLELLKKSSDRRPHMVRILLTGYTDLEALVEAVNCGLVYMYVSKPWNNDDLKLRISRAVEHYEQNKRQHALVAANDRLTARVKEMKLGFVRALASVIKMRDEFTYARGTRVSKYAAAIADSFSLHQDLFEDLIAAALLHELGTIGMSSEMLGNGDASHKTTTSVGELGTDRASHTLSCIPELTDVADIVRFQYENFDGSGHPIGLIGDQIPIASRILRVASEYDALANPKGGSQRVDHNEAMAELRRVNGRSFDPEVVQALSNLPAEETVELQELSGARVRPELITVAIN